MEIDEYPNYRLVNAILVAVALLGLAGGLIFQIGYATSAAAELGKPAGRHLGHLAWLAVVLLGFDMLMIFWLAIRAMGARGRYHRLHHRTPYVDVWAEAGQRFRLDEESQDDGPDDDKNDKKDKPQGS